MKIVIFNWYGCAVTFSRVFVVMVYEEYYFFSVDYGLGSIYE